MTISCKDEIVDGFPIDILIEPDKTSHPRNVRIGTMSSAAVGEQLQFQGKSPASYVPQFLVSKVSRFSVSKVSRFLVSKVSRFLVSKVSRFLVSKVSKFIVFYVPRFLVS